jgi:hypothetical protein
VARCQAAEVTACTAARSHVLCAPVVLRQLATVVGQVKVLPGAGQTTVHNKTISKAWSLSLHASSCLQAGRGRLVSCPLTSATLPLGLVVMCALNTVVSLSLQRAASRD